MAAPIPTSFPSFGITGQYGIPAETPQVKDVKKETTGSKETEVDTFTTEIFKRLDGKETVVKRNITQNKAQITMHRGYKYMDGASPWFTFDGKQKMNAILADRIAVLYHTDAISKETAERNRQRERVKQVVAEAAAEGRFLFSTPFGCRGKYRNRPETDFE